MIETEPNFKKEDLLNNCDRTKFKLNIWHNGYSISYFHTAICVAIFIADWTGMMNTAVIIEYLFCKLVLFEGKYSRSI